MISKNSFNETKNLLLLKLRINTDLSFLALSPPWQRTYLPVISNPFFFFKLNRSYGPYIIETVRKILVLMTSCLYFLKSGLFVKYDVLTTA